MRKGALAIAIFAAAGCVQLTGLSDLSAIDQGQTSEPNADASSSVNPPATIQQPSKDASAPPTAADAQSEEDSSTTPVVDSSTPPDPKPLGSPGIKCGTQTCTGSTRCCWNVNDSVGTCVNTATACGENNVSYTCDDAFDCDGNGGVCCGSQVVGIMLGAACSASCTQTTVCTDAKECVAGQTCTTGALGTPPTYKTCR